MRHEAPPTRPVAIPPWVVAVTGMLALAVAMGIGRFAFTPLLPMMLHDGVIDLQQGSWLAMSNYVGYWMGAMACMLQPWLWRRVLRRSHFAMVHAVRWGLGLTVVLTLAMGLNWPPAWALLRFGAGVASALVFVYTSGWCLARLAAAGVPKLGGVIYVGPGLGILISGLSASPMVSLGVASFTGWLVFGLLALVITALIWPQFSAVRTPHASVSAAAPAGTTAHGTSGPVSMGVLALAYGLAGFGYIISATFLPVMARQALPGSQWQDLFWPLFGLAIAAGALLTTRLPDRWDRRQLLIGSYAMQAAGILLAVWWPTLAGYALGSVLLGLPFTAISLFAMQEVRRVQPLAASAFMGLLTASYGLGQIAGPALVALVLEHNPDVMAGFSVALHSAAGALLLGMALYGWLVRQSTLEASIGTAT